MEFLLTVIVIFIFLGWVLRKIFPLLLAWFIKRKMKNGAFYWNPGAADAKEQEEVRRNKEQEGKVTVVTVEEREKLIEKDMGEYVDFEEEKL